MNQKTHDFKFGAHIFMLDEFETEEDLITDKNGYVEFRGFYGEYEAIVDESTIQFGIHKCENNYT